MSVDNSGLLHIFGAVVVTLGATMSLKAWLTKRSALKIEPLVDLNMQTRQLPDGSRVSQYLENGHFMTHLFDDTTTLYDCVRRGLRMSNNGPMVGYRRKQDDGSEPFVWLSYQQILDRSLDLASGFRSLGLRQGQEVCIGIYSKNRPEWIATEHAAYTYNNVIVPLYDTLGPDASSFIIGQTEIELVVCDDVSKATALVRQKAQQQCSSLKIVVVMESPTDDLLRESESVGIRVLSFDEVEKIGRGADDMPEPTPPTPDDLATISYTSGTTGMPKGVMLSHGNIVADTSTLVYFRTAQLTKDDLMISFLPMAHMFERLLQAVLFSIGARIGFFRGNIRFLVDDIRELRPTLIPVVPRVLNRVYDKVLQEVRKSAIKTKMFEWALAAKTKELNSGIVRNTSLWDILVFRKVRESLGGRVRLMITGSAPLSGEVLTFIRAALGCIVVEGYGQTECVAACTVTMEGDHQPDHVGLPSPCCAIKLVDIPELDYWAHRGVGEVLVRGANVFRGYFKDAEKTAETLSEDGWLHTGDVGRWTSRGTLKIIDRKKCIFKLAQGEYVAPERIENIYIKSEFISQVFVHGESLKSSLIAVIVPDQEILMKFVEQKLNIRDETFESLCSNETVITLIFDDLRRISKEAGLHNFEQVRKIHLCPELFSVENGLLTPTLKSRRPQLKQHFKAQLDSLYSSLD